MDQSEPGKRSNGLTGNSPFGSELRGDLSGVVGQRFALPGGAELAAAGGVEEIMRRNAADRARQAREEIARGDVLFLQGKFAEALVRFQEAVRLQPTMGDAHYRLSCAARSSGKFELVQQHLWEAVRLDPRHAGAREGLASWLLQYGQIEKALEHSAMALTLKPKRPGFIVTRATVLMGDGRNEEAAELLEPLVAGGMVDPRLAVAYAQLAPKIGREAQAAALVERVLALKEISPQVRTQFHFAAAGLLDAMGRYDEAFAQARMANERVRRPYNAANHAAFVQNQVRSYCRPNLNCLPHASHGNRRPVLIVGMPRSGTSLVEQILASHPDVFGAGELREMSLVGMSLSKAPWSQDGNGGHRLDTLSVKRANALAAEYLSVIHSLNSTARYVTDKMPLNNELLGLVELLLPDCHVIHCIRDPRDTCLSCYFTDFAEGNDFCFDLGHLANYYRNYRALMAHWKKDLAIPILDVRYEDVVADKEGQTRRMLEFLDLPWDERCLDFHKNKRLVATASRDQVRKPIYNSSVGRWKHYEKHIPELVALGDGG
ncbi:MAG TPA: sulfotransferase [Tepidisphaeraceae bacterium]|jgi:tetratricopeptide (TPR) repeat protein|nr:sulfotransferase [Tepidisphaeraceae bacterium]